MRNDTRKQFNQYRGRLAQLSGVETAAEQFAVEPSVQQKMESVIQDSSALLSKINVVGVDEIKGQKVGVGVSGPIAGRTDVDSKDRTPRSVTDLTANSYECVSTEFDTYLPWAQLDAWARQRNFQTLVRDAIVKRQALDRIMIGFNGTAAAVESDRATNKLLEDVNVGWLQQYRNNAPARVLSEGGTAGKVTVGASGDYANLDALVYDAVNELVDPWHRDDTALVAIMGRKMMADKYFPLIQQHGETPTESRALDLMISQKRVGGLQAVRAPFMRDGAIMITSLENLSIYYQRGARRRYVIDNPKRNRVENYETSNDAYVVEDYGFGCLVENIELL